MHHHSVWVCACLEGVGGHLALIFMAAAFVRQHHDRELLLDFDFQPYVDLSKKITLILSISQTWSAVFSSTTSLVVYVGQKTQNITNVVGITSQ